MDIHDQPNENDNEQALEQFKRSITNQNGRYQIRLSQKGSALQLVKVFDRAAGNYTTVGELLEEKYIHTSTIRKSLHK